MRPRINPACINADTNFYCDEIYSIMGFRKIRYFHRKEAIEKTKIVAVSKKVDITIMLNGRPFCLVEKTGEATYIYNPDLDTWTSPRLKSFFISRGFVMAHYGKVA